MAQNGIPVIASSSTQQGPPYAHIPHDSALSVGSSKADEDAAKIRDLEDEVRVLAEKANTACMYLFIAPVWSAEQGSDQVVAANRHCSQRNVLRITKTKSESSKPNSGKSRERTQHLPPLSKSSRLTLCRLCRLHRRRDREYLVLEASSAHATRLHQRSRMAHSPLRTEAGRRS